MATCPPGTYRMLEPCFSKKGYWIVGAIGTADKGFTYCSRTFTRNGIPACEDQVRDMIRKTYGTMRELTREVKKTHRMN